MFGPIPSKHLKLNDPYGLKAGLRITNDGLVLTASYQNVLFAVPFGGDNLFHGYSARRSRSRGILLSEAEISVAGQIPIGDPGDDEPGLVAVLDGVIAISALLHPWDDRGPTVPVVLDLVTGEPVSLSSPDEALWFRDWALSARFPGEDGFRIATSMHSK